jgi:hypothetical protein
MISHATTSKKNTALLVLARSLVEELRYINYPQEWGREPLDILLPFIYDVLDLHPGDLGAIIKRALRNNHISQLEAAHSKYFSKNQQYFMDLYDMYALQTSTQVSGVELSGDITKAKLDVNKKVLADLAVAVINTFAGLDAAQENAHRTLEKVCFAMPAVYYANSLVGIGFDIAEYADQWRGLSTKERLNLKTEILERWQ